MSSKAASGIFSPPFDQAGDLTIPNNVTFEGTLTVEGDFTFGDAATDSLTITGDFAQTYSGTSDGHTVSGTGDLTAGKDLARFSTTGSISSTSNVVAIEQTTGAGAAGAYGLYINCTGTNVEGLKVDAGGVVFDETLEVSGLVKLNASAGADAANALLMGVGTSGNPATTSTASKFFMEFRCQSTASSGDNRLLYMRYDLNGGGGGEALRAFTKVTASTGTARGAHISLDVSTDGAISGLGAGVDAQLLLPGEALASGTWAASNAEVFTVASGTVGSATVSLFRGVASGDGTAIADFDDNGYFLELGGIAAGSGNIIDTDITTHTAYGGLKVKIPGVGTRWLALVSA